MPRLQDGTFDARAEELEETETNQIALLLQRRTKEGNMEYLHTVDGIAHYRMLTPVVFK